MGLQDIWEAIKQRLARTIDVDNRLRIFYSGPLADADAFQETQQLEGWSSMDVGLVYACSRGALDLDRVQGAHYHTDALLFKVCWVCNSLGALQCCVLQAIWPQVPELLVDQFL